MRLFPRRTPDQKREDVRQWSWITLVLAATGIAGIAIFALSDVLPWSGDILTKFRWIALLVGVFAAYLALQSVVNLLVEMTIGPERFIAGFVVLALLAGLYQLIWGEG